jgi:hypothetical protein
MSHRVFDLWSDDLFYYYDRPVLMRMITAEKLDALIEETADIDQLQHIHDALRELQWRRKQQGKVENKLDLLNKTITVMRAPWYARLKFW